MALVCAAFPATSAEPEEKDLATQLVELMGVDEAAAQRLHADAEAYYRESTLTRAQHDCVMATNRTEFTEEYAEILRKGLSEIELREAIAYFSSDVGRRHLATMDARENVTGDDWRKRRAFLDTSAGYRLITRKLLTDETATRWIGWRMSGRFRQCEDATESSPRPKRAH